MSDRVAGEIARGLQSRGCHVHHPLSLIEFTRLISFDSSVGFAPNCAPNCILNVHSQNTSQVLDVCAVAGRVGIRVMNTHHAVRLCEDRAHLLQCLKQGKVAVPDFFTVTRH